MSEEKTPSRLIIISGRSGSGKSTVLDVFEDAGYYSIDNLPGNLFTALIQDIQNCEYHAYENVVISLDARNSTISFDSIIEQVQQLPESIKCNILYLDSNSPTLVKRYSETRRKHPLSKNNVSLKEAIELEKERLAPFKEAADLSIDTSSMGVMELRQIVRKRISQSTNKNHNEAAVLFKSFGFKSGVPIDADMVFDVRCLVNPYWHQELRSFTGLDPEIKDFLGQDREANELFHDISTFLDRWIPRFSKNQRSYITIAIGCTGGIHRSVYLSERLKAWYSIKQKNVQIHHRELNNKG